MEAAVPTVTVAPAAEIVTAPELVIGVVTPLGTDTKRLVEEIAKELSPYGYATSVIRLSDHFRDSNIDPAEETEDLRVTRLMGVANEFCEEHQDAAAMGSLAVSLIRTRRRELNASHGKTGGDKDLPISRTAFIVHSLKRPHEVTRLKDLYGAQFILLARQDTPEKRRDWLLTRLRGVADASSKVDSLIARDADETNPMGQSVNETYRMADYFLGADESPDRAIELMFDDNRLSATFPEYAMYMALACSARSRAPSRKVGAAITTGEDLDDHIVSLGYNDVLPSEVSDQTRGYDMSEALKDELIEDTIAHLRDAKLLAPKKDPDAREALRAGSKLLDIIEYQPQVHAEASAISDAAQRGVALRGTSLFVTTYPCHLCFKEVAASGIKRVHYIHPYPKSRAEVMFPQSSKVLVPYIGLAPHLFMRIFSDPPAIKADSAMVFRQKDRQDRLPRFAETWKPEETARREIDMISKLFPKEAHHDAHQKG